ncbi:MAG: Gfo/Idh/MocA family oxidoreductase [Actinobacteria bacterium]|nr:Gfo/Idh/MocA family oxidoreductase [Actinomycetota bacterium]
MKTFRWGIISTGGIARAFAKDLQYVTGHSVAAVGSRSMEAAKAFADLFPGAVAYDSYESLVADPSIDGVYVATPHPYHVSNTILALQAGKPVLCEKPFAVTAAEAELMINTAREKNLALMEAMWTRFLPHIQVVRQILKDGILGEILHVEADHGQALQERNIPRINLPEYAGGAILDLGIYPVSFAHLVLGPPEKITATGKFTKDGVDSQTTAIFDYASGAQAIVTANMIVKSPCRAVICGTLGRLEIDRTFYNPASMRVIMKDESVTEYPRNYEGHGLREQAVEFARIVAAGLTESPLLNLDETLIIMRAMDEIRRQIGLKFPFETH